MNSTAKRNTCYGSNEAINTQCRFANESGVSNVPDYLNVFLNMEVKYLFFVGDSITEGYVKHFACLLYQLFPSSKQYYRVQILDDACRHVDSETGISRCYTFKLLNGKLKEVVVCWFSAGKAFGVSLKTQIYKIHQNFAGKEKLVVYNTGIHFHNPAAAVHQTMAAAKIIETFEDKNDYIFRETTPQFFDSPDGGYPKRNKATMVCLSHKFPTKAIYGMQIDKLKEKKLKYWPIRDKTVSYSPVDVLGVFLHNNKPVLDCSHPCIFGPTYFQLDQELLREVRLRATINAKRRYDSDDAAIILKTLGMLQVPLEYLYTFGSDGRRQKCWLHKKYDVMVLS